MSLVGDHYVFVEYAADTLKHTHTWYGHVLSIRDYIQLGIYAAVLFNAAHYRSTRLWLVLAIVQVSALIARMSVMPVPARQLPAAVRCVHSCCCCPRHTRLLQHAGTRSGRLRTRDGGCSHRRASLTSCNLNLHCDHIQVLACRNVQWERPIKCRRCPQSMLSRSWLSRIVHGYILDDPCHASSVPVDVRQIKPYTCCTQL